MAKCYDSLPEHDIELSEFQRMLQWVRDTGLACVDVSPTCNEAQSFYYLALGALDQAKYFLALAAQKHAEERARIQLGGPIRG